MIISITMLMKMIITMRIMTTTTNYKIRKIRNIIVTIYWLPGIILRP